MLYSNIGNISSGLVDGLVSPFEEQIMQELGMRVDLHSLLVGSVSIGGLFGCFISGKLADTIGRKRAFGIAFSFTALGCQCCFPTLL